MTTDIKYYLTGGSSNTDQAASLGGVSSSHQIVSDVINEVFGDITPSERASGVVKYRYIDAVNEGNTDTVTHNFYISSNTPSTDTALAVAYDDTAGSHALTDDLETLASETTAPTDVTAFSAPSSGSPIVLPSIVVGEAVS